MHHLDWGGVCKSIACPTDNVARIEKREIVS